MVGRNVLRSCLVVAVLLGARTAAGGRDQFTGNVTSDFNPRERPRCDRSSRTHPDRSRSHDRHARHGSLLESS